MQGVSTQTQENSWNELEELRSGPWQHTGDSGPQQPRGHKPVLCREHAGYATEREKESCSVVKFS